MDLHSGSGLGRVGCWNTPSDVAMGKTPSLGVRLKPEVKLALQNAAEADLRSVSSMVEKILTEWLRGKGYLAKVEVPKRAK
jgi:hypothetical protein